MNVLYDAFLLFAGISQFSAMHSVQNLYFSNNAPFSRNTNKFSIFDPLKYPTDHFGSYTEFYIRRRRWEETQFSSSSTTDSSIL